LKEYRGTNGQAKLLNLSVNYGYDMIDVKGDGNCLFRAVSKSLRLNYAIKISYRKLRQDSVDYLDSHRELLDIYLPYLSKLPQEAYLVKMSKDGEWGNVLSLLSLSEVLKVQFNVLSVEFGSFIKVGKFYNKIIPLGFIDEFHYTALVQSQSRVPAPSAKPSRVPSPAPSAKPSHVPSLKPSRVPSPAPFRVLSVAPSVRPSRVPSPTPSLKPSRVPSVAPQIPPPIFGKPKQLASVNELLELMDKARPYIYDDISQLKKADRQILISLGM
jgi:hypothetical protein